MVNLGRVDYAQALALQEELVSQLHDGNAPEQILFCSHDPLVTLGKKTLPEDLGAWQGEVYRVQRGGRATYHGPSQVICYPIIHLKKRNNDIYKYLRFLEEAMVATLRTFGVLACGDPSATGVWVESRKIASIGIAIRRGVTFHGLAINLYFDEAAFQGINPCGMRTDTMISLEEILAKKVARADFERSLQEQLLAKLSVDNFH